MRPSLQLVLADIQPLMAFFLMGDYDEAVLAVEEPVKAPVRAVYGWTDGLVADHKAHLLPLQSADGAELKGPGGAAWTSPAHGSAWGREDPRER